MLFQRTQLINVGFSFGRNDVKDGGNGKLGVTTANARNSTLNGCDDVGDPRVDVADASEPCDRSDPTIDRAELTDGRNDSTEKGKGIRDRAAGEGRWHADW